MKTRSILSDPMADVRLALLRAGRHATSRQLANLRSALSYLELGQWLANDHCGIRLQVVGDEFDLFEVARRRTTGRAPLYLEFGVFEGRSMRWWSRNLSQPEARLVGFDSFEGLPENWRPGIDAGHFQTGRPPEIDDSRVSFEVGWFDETLPGFDVPDHDQLIVNVDSDLYSSASTVLHWLEPHVRPGTMIYFDEFPDRDHEMKAFNELRARSAHRFTPVAIAHGGVHWLFEASYMSCHSSLPDACTCSLAGRPRSQLSSCLPGSGPMYRDRPVDPWPRTLGWAHVGPPGSYAGRSPG